MQNACKKQSKEVKIKSNCFVARQIVEKKNFKLNGYEIKNPDSSVTCKTRVI